MSGRAWRAWYRVRRVAWRVRHPRRHPVEGWGMTEVNAPRRLPGGVEPGDLLIVTVTTNPDATATYFREAGSDDTWREVGS